ncbi:outer membrane protein assembly factor BamD, partial [Psychrobacter sp. I-STPA6b]|uniref:outer membrane protein assembly factor BamD n=1 Tax=Psychrobacter sp. I-STPA6b TaxID=2585718 RepID=UPI001D0C29B7
RTFYPTGRYAEQALLDMMYAQFEINEYEAAANSSNQFISLYPSNPQVSYAYYVRGVANMQGSSEGIKLFPVNQAERDTAYYRLAFANFQELIGKYPNSPYAPDAAQRMIFIYNQFAESELNAANWYIEREAYVAAANRAKWVFQY